jgi:hypothetical protein
MGLNQNSNRIYLSVADGKIIQRVKEGTPNAIQRVTKNGKTVHEIKFGSLSGFLSGVSIKENEFGKDWVFEIEDNGEVFNLQMMYNSRYATTFLNALLNPVVDLNMPITITPWSKEVDGKSKTAVYLKQGEEDIKWYFTKDEPNGMPPLEKVVFKGKEQWDDFKIMEFLKAQVESKIKPNLYKSSPGYAKPADGLKPSEQFNPPSGQSYPPSDLNHVEDPDSDLPF